MRSPMKRVTGGDPVDEEMNLPAGTTCADCVHCYRCCKIYGHIPEDEVCDFHPSQFRQRTDPKPEEPTDA